MSKVKQKIAENIIPNRMRYTKTFKMYIKLLETMYKNLKEEFDQGLHRLNAQDGRWYERSRVRHTETIEEKRICSKSIRRYIEKRNLCCDCLFDKSGYWKLRDRLNSEISNILKNLVEEMDFIKERLGKEPFAKYVPGVIAGIYYRRVF